MTLLLSASLVNYFRIITMSLTGFSRWEIFTSNLGFFFVTQNFIRSCVIHSIFFPTHSYMFFQWKTFQMRLQDFRFFIPPKCHCVRRLGAKEWWGKFNAKGMKREVTFHGWSVKKEKKCGFQKKRFLKFVRQDRKTIKTAMNCINVCSCKYTKMKDFRLL
jgi:hypothetical protein